MKVEELNDTELKDDASVKCQQDKDNEWEYREVRIHCQTKKIAFLGMECDWLLPILTTAAGTWTYIQWSVAAETFNRNIQGGQ